MRFDDSLDTVLAAETATPSGAEYAWRQLVDLAGRGRVVLESETVEHLQTLRPVVPAAVRAASARALATATPSFALVRLFASDESAIAAPVLRTAHLRAEEWIELLPMLSPAARSILRHRRDLPPAVGRALESFGPVDFVLGSRQGQLLERAGMEGDRPSVAANQTLAPVASSPFLSIASVAMALPIVAEALRLADSTAHEQNVAASPPPEANRSKNIVPLHPPHPSDLGTFPIAELVARIDEYQRRQTEPQVSTASRNTASQPFSAEPLQCMRFAFETDATGVVQFVEGVDRAPLIGFSLDTKAKTGRLCVDGVAAGAFRRRASFSDARLTIDGFSGASGEWRVSGVPVFDRLAGRFSGYRATARRPRPDESATPLRTRHDSMADTLRQLVHELRTPTSAICGLAEMIETEILGSVAAPYRSHAATIRSHANDLLTAIEDIDMAARIEAQALVLRPGEVPLAPLLARVNNDLTELLALRETSLAIPNLDLVVSGDERAVERLIGRLMAALVSATGPGERIGVAVEQDDDRVLLVFDRPVSLSSYSEKGLLTLDAEIESQGGGGMLLGTGFALRLARNLATQLGGDLVIGETTMTLCLPSGVNTQVDQVTYN